MTIFFDQLICGIPYIILEGTAEDYKKIILKAKNLSKYDFKWYIDRVIPIIEKMVEAKEGKIDINFFKNIIRKDSKLEERCKDCNLDQYKINYIDGWILKFFGYIKYDQKLIRFLGDKIEGDGINNLANQILNTPFIIRKIDESEKNMKFEAGFFGCEQNEKKEVSLCIGWMVSPSDSWEKGCIDKQFESKNIRNLESEEFVELIKKDSFF